MLDFRGQRRIVAHGRRKPAVGMRAFLRRCRRPTLSAPIQTFLRWPVLAFPPHVAVGGQSHIGEDGVALDDFHRVRVGARIGAGDDAEIARLRVDGIEASVGSGFHPGDVVSHRPDLPPGKMLGRNHHGEVGFSTGAGESGRKERFFSGRGFHSENQHVFGQPAFLTPKIRADAQGQTLFAQ